MELNQNQTNPDIVKIPKKRGRKPKGGKIFKKISDINIVNIEPNIILHLKCKDSDLNNLNDIENQIHFPYSLYNLIYT